MGTERAAVPSLSVIGIDQRVSALGTEPSRARNFTLRWEGRLLAMVPWAGGCRQPLGARPQEQAHR